MGVFEFVIGIIFLVGVGGPVAKGIGARIARSGRTDGADVKQLQEALLVADQRLSESERRIGSMEERLDFYEKLLGETDRHRQLKG